MSTLNYTNYYMQQCHWNNKNVLKMIDKWGHCKQQATHQKEIRPVKTIMKGKEKVNLTSFTLTSSCKTSSFCSLVNSWWDVDRRWDFQNGLELLDFSFLGLASQIWGWRCLLGVLGVDVKTSCFKATTSACNISILNWIQSIQENLQSRLVFWLITINDLINRSCFGFLNLI